MVPLTKCNDDSISTNIIVSAGCIGGSIALNDNVYLLHLVQHTPYPKTLTLKKLCLNNEPLLYFKRLFEGALITKITLDDTFLSPFKEIKKIDNSGFFQALTLLPTLRKLKIKYTELVRSDFGALHWLLISSNTLTSVSFSCISFSEATCDNLTMLFHGLQHSKMERLVIERCKFPAHFDIKRLLDNVTTLRELKIIDHADHIIYGEALTNLVTCIATHPTLKKVFIDCRRLGYDDALYIFVELLAHNKSLEVLNIAGYTMVQTIRQFDIVCGMLNQNPSLRMYNQQWLVTENNTMQSMCNLYKNTDRLQNLAVAFHISTDMDLQPFVDVMSTNTTITELRCDVAFKHTYRSIPDVVDAIVNNTTLRSLTIFISSIFEPNEPQTMMKRLFAGLATNTTLTSLKLRCNYIHYDKIENEFVHFIKTNTTLVTLNAKNILNNKQCNTTNAIINALAVNTTLQTLICRPIHYRKSELEQSRINFINNNTTLIRGSDLIMDIEGIDDVKCYRPLMKARNYALNLSLFDLLFPIAATFE